MQGLYRKEEKDSFISQIYLYLSNLAKKLDK
jgi:hypothetical protein